VSETQTHVTVTKTETIPSRFYANETDNTRIEIKEPVSNAVQTEPLQEVFTHYRREAEKQIGRLGKRGRAFAAASVSFIKEKVRAVKTAFSESWSSYYAGLSEQTKQIGYTISVSLAAACACCLLLVLTCSIGYEITINGTEVGVIKNKAQYRSLLADINHEIAYITTEPFAEPAAKLSLKVIPKGAFDTELALREGIKAQNSTMLPAYAVYADGQLLFAVPNQQAALSVLEDYKAQFTEGQEDVRAEFNESVLVARRFVPIMALKTETRAREQLAEGRVILHSVEAGETSADIAARYGISEEALCETNRIAGSLAGKKELSIYTNEPLLSVTTVSRKTIEEEIPFASIEREDPTKYEGNITVEQAGMPGSCVVEAYVTSVNGVETGRKVISETVLSAATDEIISKGTKEPPSPIGTGQLTVPTSGNLSSRYGSRWGRRHEGIDMTAPTGTPIYAADNGRVVYAEFNSGGYGNMVQIDHGNGVTTYYAHCSELLVSEGAVVAKGDVIARVGNTGRSTGPHLHFEVRVNGTPADPMQYVNGIK